MGLAQSELILMDQAKQGQKHDWADPTGMKLGDSAQSWPQAASRKKLEVRVVAM